MAKRAQKGQIFTQKFLWVCHADLKSDCDNVRCYRVYILQPRCCQLNCAMLLQALCWVFLVYACCVVRWFAASLHPNLPVSYVILMLVILCRASLWSCNWCALVVLVSMTYWRCLMLNLH